MAILDRSAILVVADLPRELVEVPEWGGSVFVRTLTGAERDAWEFDVSKSKEAGNVTNFRAGLVALAVCGEDGKRLFTDLDVEALGEKSAAALDRIFDAAAKLSRLGKQDVEAAAKN